MHKILSWARRPQTWGFFVSLAVMAAISIAFFYPDNFEGHSLMQQDMQQGQAVGHEAQAWEEATGEKPLWTNSIFSGMPTFQISPSYPSNDLFSWINKVCGLWLPAPSNLMFMMMLGFLILLYCMGMRWYYALLGAIAWGFSSYFVIIIGAGHIWKFCALAYIPPTIGGLILCYRGRWLSGGAITAIFTMMQLNANHPQMTYYFAFVMAGLAIAYLVEAIRAKQMKQWCVATIAVLVAGALALGANSPSLYNTYAYAKETKRSQSELTAAQPAAEGVQADKPTGGLPRQQILMWSYGRSEMFSLLVPNIKGGGSAKPEKGQMVALTAAELPQAEDVPQDVAYLRTQQGAIPILNYFSQYFNDSEGTNGPVYVGALILALFLLGCFIVKGPVKWALLSLTLLSMLLALGYNLEWLSDLMIYHFPLYNKFRAVESILVIAEFTIPLLAVMGLCKYLEWCANAKNDAPKGGFTPQIAMYVSFGACALICVAGMCFAGIFGDVITRQDQSMMSQLSQYGVDTLRLKPALEQLRHSVIAADSQRSLLIIAIGFVILWLCSMKKISAPLAVAGVTIVVLADLYTVDKRYVSHSSFIEGSGEVATAQIFTPDQIDLLILQDNSPHYRVMDIPGFDGHTRAYHHKMIGGYHAAKLNRYEDLINNRIYATRAAGYHPELLDDSIAALYGPDDADMVAQLRASLRTLNMLNARYIITGDKQAPVVFNPDALGNAWIVDEISYVDNAQQEMDALLAIDPARQAVADKKFQAVLGEASPASPGDTIALESYAPDKLTYRSHAGADALAVFSEVYFPWGWNAEIDGEPAEIGRVNYTLRAMKIPAGDHTITMEFKSTSIRATSALAYASISLIYIWVLAAIALAAMAGRKASKE